MQDDLDQAIKDKQLRQENRERLRKEFLENKYRDEEIQHGKIL